MSHSVDLLRSAPLRLPPHPDRPQNESWRSWVLRQTAPRAVDLFAGCGGLSLGLEQAGYRVILSVDNDPWSIETHRHNFPGSCLDLDLSNPERVEGLIALLSGIQLDLVAGGPPCQPFSRAGRSKIRSLVEAGVRHHRDERRDLWQSFLRVVEALRPRAVLMENVPDMALGDELRTVRTMLSRLEAAGYGSEAALVETSRHGVPQHRERLILVGVREGSFLWPRRQRAVTLRAAIADLPKLGHGCGAPEMRYASPRTAFQQRAREGMNGNTHVVWDHVTRPVREDDREAFALMTPKTRYSDLPEHLRRYRSDIFDDKYHRLGWDQLSRSITAHIAKDGYSYIHPSEARTLTVREAARVQAFPDHFRFAGSRSHQFRQIGNAVPPALAEALGRALLAGRSTLATTGDVSGARRFPDIRSALLSWAATDAKRAPWRHPCDAWDALAGIILDPRPPAGEHLVGAFLRRWPRPASIDARQARQAIPPDDVAARARVRRLYRAASAFARGDGNEQSWPRAAALGEAERALWGALALREDMVLVTAATLRVTARLGGTKVHRERSLSAGRIAVGHVVGHGADVPALNAALHALGLLICRADELRCSECPLSGLCATAGGASETSRVALASRRALARAE